MDKEKLLISACLLGEKCRYDGKDNKMDHLEFLFRAYEVIPICPEVEGGLSTPRIPAEIKGSQVINQVGEDVTAAFVEGARKTLEKAEKIGCKKALLKAKSPSCGLGEIYDGSFQGRLISGHGVTAKLLLNHGIDVYSEKNWKDLLK